MVTITVATRLGARARDEELRMRPKEPTGGEDLDLFRAGLENIVEQRHSLVRLAALIDWKRFDGAFGVSIPTGSNGPGCRSG
jgi:IS5 family transposase